MRRGRFRPVQPGWMLSPSVCRHIDGVINIITHTARTRKNYGIRREENYRTYGTKSSLFTFLGIIRRLEGQDASDRGLATHPMIAPTPN